MPTEPEVVEVEPEAPAEVIETTITLPIVEYKNRMEESWQRGHDHAEEAVQNRLDDTYTKGWEDGVKSVKDQGTLRQMSLDRALTYVQHSWKSDLTVADVLKVSETIRKYITEGATGNE